MIELRGIAWDHPRGYEPLIKLSEKYSELNPAVQIKWDVRSLKEFGDMPIEDLIERYDLLTIDHPYMGQAHENKLLRDLKPYLSSYLLNEHSKQSVGPGFQSYFFDDHLYALPIDAAALVAAYRKDLLERHQLTFPETWAELKHFYTLVPTGHAVAWPLCPTDLWCSFLTLCAQSAGRDFIRDFKVNEKAGIIALDELKFHLEYLHPDSIHWNPIQILDRMSDEDEIIYSPYLFGYSNYSREGYASKLVHFANSPQNPQQDISTILGGVGLAVSAHCEATKEAVDFANYVAHPENQEGAYLQHAGQPGSLKAWESEQGNALCHNFFRDTLATLEKAYVRPQHPGWNNFQEQGADLLHEGLIKNQPSDTLIKQLNELYKTILQHVG
ncbi:carbohydrate ABC transporter substrate-binding protein [Fulvivirga sp. M361]|uniref:ABC transporter substrate-binding protein n=1 Tax=Fulvivirga sp. M361 TaxID=2594266 RepID=UPI00117B16F9|nr:ABC transporter substrate-binding protein [Fulvivirga sp. M361]TRX60051.1 carbohydrate ABC transporter substrate-binding protein [Fulvivirga sp. M361]